MKPYLQPIGEVFADVKSCENGLTAEESEARLQSQGKNKLAEGKKEPLFRKVLRKAAQKALGKGTGPSNLLKSILASFCHASKNGCKKARKSLKLLGFSQRHFFGCSLMVETGGLGPSTSCV